MKNQVSLVYNINYIYKKILFINYPILFYLYCHNIQYQIS